MAKWPCLVLPQFCNTPIQVVIESEDLNENGTPKVLLDWSGNCNYQDQAKRLYKDEKAVVQIVGTCLIPGDIAPTMAVFPSGKVTVNGVERVLSKGIKARNPDGTVNYTCLELE